MDKLHRFQVAFVSEDGTDGAALLPFLRDHLENLDLGGDVDFDDVEFEETVDIDIDIDDDEL